MSISPFSFSIYLSVLFSNHVYLRTIYADTEDMKMLIVIRIETQCDCFCHLNIFADLVSMLVCLKEEALKFATQSIVLTHLFVSMLNYRSWDCDIHIYIMYRDSRKRTRTVLLVAFWSCGANGFLPGIHSGCRSQMLYAYVVTTYSIQYHTHPFISTKSSLSASISHDQNM